MWPESLHNNPSAPIQSPCESANKPCGALRCLPRLLESNKPSANVSMACMASQSMCGASLGGGKPCLCVAGARGNIIEGPAAICRGCHKVVPGCVHGHRRHRVRVVLHEHPSYETEALTTIPYQKDSYFACLRSTRGCGRAQSLHIMKDRAGAAFAYTGILQVLGLPPVTIHSDLDGHPGQAEHLQHPALGWPWY